MNKLMMDGWRGTQIDGWIKESMSKWIDCGLMAEWIGGFMNGLKDNGLMDGSMNE